MYLKGWLHAHERRVTELRVRLGSEEALITFFHERPDLLHFFAEHPHVIPSGFTAYVEGRAGRPVTLHITTQDGGQVEMPLELPAGPLPIWPETA